MLRHNPCVCPGTAGMQGGQKFSNLFLDKHLKIAELLQRRRRWVVQSQPLNKYGKLIVRLR
ncbi:MAG: hypothetical protein MRK01_01990 [Candidatus Scalindua sp.]|nr:hypothetical protein [Candidatus Scalindua sp.]